MSILKKVTEKSERSAVIDELDNMREKVEEKQKKMANEDFDKAKLKPILEEAYRLIMLLDERNENKNSTIQKLEKEKEKLKDLKKEWKNQSRIEDRLENESILFKSIMCPLGDRCPKDNRARWPKSGTKTVTPFGDKCLYAHHYHELEFPETISTKIAAITHMQKKVGQLADKDVKASHPFKPASSLKDCKGCHNCNYCKFRYMNADKKKED